MGFENKVIDVVVEIPAGSQNKYEFDKEKGVFKLDRVLFSPMHYPTEYGYIENSLALDGDPLDVLVYTTFPTFPGCMIESRVIGMLNMSDEKGQDEKLLGVPTEDPRFKDVHTLDDMPQHVLAEIAHFFKVYKDLENKETNIEGWEGPERASVVIDECIARFKEN